MENVMEKAVIIAGLFVWVGMSENSLEAKVSWDGENYEHVDINNEIFDEFKLLRQINELIYSFQ